MCVYIYIYILKNKELKIFWRMCLVDKKVKDKINFYYIKKINLDKI